MHEPKYSNIETVGGGMMHEPKCSNIETVDGGMMHEPKTSALSAPYRYICSITLGLKHP